MAKIRIPNNWSPRQYQMPLWTYLENGGRRACEIAHRRWGKDEIGMHWSMTAQTQTPGNYWHMLPEAAQARKAIWDAINPHTGKKRIDEAFPKEIRSGKSEQEMRIETVFNTSWQVVGSDNFDSLVGSPPVGIVFSEWALAKPEAWAYLRPILAENNGWALFITTPRGKNHAKAIYDLAVEEKEWYGQISTVDDTNVFTPDQLVSEQRELVKLFGASRGEALFRQEYYCSFDEAFTGKVVYPEFSMKVHVSQEPLLPMVISSIENSSNKQVVRGWDNTGLHPGCTLSYVLPMGRVRVFKEFWNDDIGMGDYAESVDIWCRSELPQKTKYRDIGDPAQKTRDTNKRTPHSYIKERIGIDIEDGVQTFKIRRQAVADLLNKQVLGEPAMQIDPTQCPILLSGFMGGYGYAEIGTSGVYHKEPLKDKYADVHDSLQYPMTVLFPVKERQTPSGINVGAIYRSMGV